MSHTLFLYSAYTICQNRCYGVTTAFQCGFLGFSSVTKTAPSVTRREESKKMNERRGVTDKILEYCEATPGLFLRKIHCGAMQGKGLPDLWGTYRGMFIVCESKTPEGRLSYLQKHFLQLINRAGGCAFTATSLEEFQQKIAAGWRTHLKEIGERQNG